MPLLPKVPIVVGESLTSYLNRVASFHFNLGLADFLHSFEIPQYEAMFPLPKTMERISKMTGYSFDDLSKTAFVKSGSRQRSIGGELVHIKFVDQKTRPFCPACLLEDIESDSCSNGMPVGRIEWQINCVWTCTKHGIILQALRTKTYADRFNLMPELSADKIGLQRAMDDAVYQRPSGLQKYIMARIEGQSGPAWLDDQQLDLAARACELLGIVITRGASVNLNFVDQQQWAEAGDVGFDFACRGEEGVREGLKLVYDRHVQRGDGAGPQKAFGRLYQSLQNKKNDKFRSHISSVARDFILDHFPIEVGANLFNKPVDRQRVHTVNSLSRASKIHVKSLRHAAEVTGLVKASQEPKFRHQIFDFEAGERLAKMMHESMPMNALPSYLNCNRIQAEELVRSGIIPRIFVGETVKSGILTNVSISDAEDFLQKFMSKAKKVSETSEGTMDILTASQSTHVPVIDIINGILSGRLRAVEVLDDRLKFKGVLVHPAEIRSELDAPPDDGFVWKIDAAEMLGVSGDGMTKLAKLRRPSGDNYFTKIYAEREELRSRRMFKLDEIAEFRKQHVLIREYAGHANVSPMKAVALFRNQGLKAIVPQKNTGVLIYRRSDVFPDE